LPAYSFVLALIALLGFMAIAAGVDKVPEFASYFKQYGPNFAVPALFLQSFPAWFVGFAFAAIGVGALVPAAIMSIAAANLYTRNIYRPFINTECTPRREAQMAKWVSLIVKFGALLFIIFLPQQYAIQLQLLGGVWIVQTLPAVIIGLYVTWLDPKALLLGWAAGIVSGTWMVATLDFKGSIFSLVIDHFSMPAYAAVYSLILNVAVAVIVSVALRAFGAARFQDETVASDYR